MGFKKIALVTAIAAAPLSAYAMEDLNDEAMSAVSGQDGVSLVLGIPTTGITTDIFIHDKDGLAGLAGASSTYSFDGAIVIDNMVIANAGVVTNITIAIDAGDSAATTTSPVLNINIGLPAALTIGTGAIRVANSQRDEAAWSVGTMSSTIMNAMTIILGGTTLNIQLGAEAQTGQSAGSDMAVLSATVTGGISISGFRVSDASNSGDGGIGATTMTLLNNGGTDLDMKLDINATDAGLVVTLGQLGSATTGMDIRIVDQYLGTSTNAKIGDITVSGLNLNGATLTINGK